MGCGPSKPSAEIVQNQEQAAEKLAKIRELTEEPLLKRNDNMDLSERDRKNLEAALPLVQSLIEFDPIAIGTITLRGKIEVALDRLDEAEATFKQALKVAPAPEHQNTDIKFLMAGINDDLSKIEFIRGNYKKSIEYIEEALKFSPNNPIYLTNLAYSQVEARELEAAKETVKKIQAIDPKNEDVKMLLKLIEG